MHRLTLGTSRTRYAVGAGNRALVGITHTLAAVALLVSTAAAQPPATPAPQPTQSTPLPAATITPIPIPEVAQRAEQVTTLLRSAETTATDQDVEDATRQLSLTGKWIAGHLVSASQALASSPSETALANLADSWQAMRSRLTDVNNRLTAHATLVQQRLEQIETMRATWEATRTSAQQAAAPSTVLERIDDTIDTIAVARKHAAGGLAKVLELQDRAIKEIARCDDVLTRIAASAKALQGPLLSRDAPPIWSPRARTLFSGDPRGRVRDAVREIADRTQDFWASDLPRFPVQIVLLVLGFVLMRRARLGARRSADKEPSEAAAAQVFEAPLSCALVITLLPTAWIYPHVPRVVLSAVALLVLLSVVLIVRRLASPALVPVIYALAAFFLVDRIRDLCSLVAVVEQWVFLLEMLAGIAFLALAVRSEQLLRQSGSEIALGWRRVIAAVLWGQIFVLVVAVFTGGFGYMRLARLLGGAVVTSNYAALVLYAAVRVGVGLIAYALRVGPPRTLLIVQRHRALLQQRLSRALGCLAVGAWAYFALDGLGVMSSLVSAGEAALNARYVRGSVSLSLGDVVAFALTIWGVFLVSSFVRFALEEEVYPRVQLPRGAPYALSTILHYIIVIVGFVFAVAALGVDLNRITILAGALGVGVGIGLQNVVANFVSGLILLLERRLHVGDAVQLGDLQGRIREIGSRASTIRTWDGAEVIVPNAVLTSERVINWTLSDALRRVDLELGVAYAADPERVLEILRNVATAHPKTLKDPAPLAVCTGFGDSALKFELRAWTRLEDADLLRSQLAIGVRRALADAKIDIPFPQRDVHIRNGDGARLA